MAADSWIFDGTPAGLDAVLILLWVMVVEAALDGTNGIEELLAVRDELNAGAADGPNEREGGRPVEFPTGTLVGIAAAGIVENSMVVTT